MTEIQQYIGKYYINKMGNLTIVKPSNIKKKNGEK